MSIGLGQAFAQQPPDEQTLALCHTHPFRMVYMYGCSLSLMTQGITHAGYEPTTFANLEQRNLYQLDHRGCPVARANNYNHSGFLQRSYPSLSDAQAASTFSIFEPLLFLISELVLLRNTTLRTNRFTSHPKAVWIHQVRLLVSNVSSLCLVNKV